MVNTYLVISCLLLDRFAVLHITDNGICDANGRFI